MRNINYFNSVRNDINNCNLGQETSLNFVNKKTLDLTVGTRISYNTAGYSVSRHQSTSYWNQEYSFDGSPRITYNPPAGDYVFVD